MADDLPSDDQDRLVPVRVKLAPEEAEKLPPELAADPTGIIEFPASVIQLISKTTEQQEQHFRDVMGHLQKLADVNTYQPAKEFLCERFPTFKAIQKALDENRSISWRHPAGKNGKPKMNRKEIHVGQWFAVFKQQLHVDPFDHPGPIVDAVMDLERRKAEVDAEKEKKIGK